MTAIRAVQISQARLAREEPGEVDLWVLIPTLALVALGVAMGYSASIPLVASQGGNVFSYLGKELAFVAAGVAGMAAAMRLRMSWLSRHARVLLAATVLLLAGVLFAPARNGARSWYPIPGTGLSFQPSELAKLVLVIALARCLARFPRGLPDWRAALRPLVITFAVVGLVAVEPDMGTAAVTAVAIMVYLHIGGAKLRHLAAAAVLAGGAAAAVVLQHTYQVQRLVDFFRGSEAELAGGYQRARSLIALGSGGLTGCGYCGSVEKYFYLPAATTDSILAVVGEELGLLFTWGVVAVFAILVRRGLQIAGRAPDRFSGLVAAGVTCLIGTQALLNIAVVTGSIPATGVPLPFVSYGGSALVVSLFGMGLLMNVSRSSRQERQGHGEPARGGPRSSPTPARGLPRRGWGRGPVRQ